MALPAWFNGKGDKRKQNARSRAHERKVAKETGGRTTPGSGSSWRAPGDVKSDTHLIQHKYTDAKSYRLTVEEWIIYRDDATRAGREPAIFLDFDSSGISLAITERRR